MSSQKKNKGDRSVYLNDFLIEEILHVVDQKTLHRSISVCKKWERIIYKSAFKEKSKSPPPLVTGFFGVLQQGVSFCNLGTDNLADTSLSFLQRPVQVVASGDGLVLCKYATSSSDLQYMVCNLLTKQSLDLPRDESSPSIVYHTVMFSYINRESGIPRLEFKVVSFIRRHHQRLEVDTYSSETRRWTKNLISHEGIIYFNSRVLFNKCVYFMGDRETLAYDLNKQSISSLELPEHDGSWKYLGVSAGSLFYCLSDKEGNFEMWVLVGENQWSLKHRTKLKIGGLPIVRVHPLDPDTILFGCDPAILYNIRTSEMKTLNDFKHLNHLRAISYCLPRVIFRFPTVDY